MILPLLLTLLSASPTLQAEPAELVLTDGATSKLVLSGVGPSAEVSFSTQLGAVSDVKSVGQGRFEATYTPPAQRHPQVAIVVAEVKVGSAVRRQWLALRLLGAKPLKLATKPFAHVEVIIAGRTFGPVEANKVGDVEVPVVVPPGLGTAVLKSVDRAGNRSTSRTDLAPPPFPRIHLVPLPDRVASKAETPLHLYLVEPDGKPSTVVPTLKASLGEVGGVKRVAPGEFLATFKAPARIGDGTAVLTARFPGAPPSGNPLTLPLRAGAVTRIELQLSSMQVVAGTQAPVTVEATAFDGEGNLVTGQRCAFTSSVGELAVDAEGCIALLRVPGFFNGQTEVTVEAIIGGGRGKTTLALRPSAPTQGRVSIEPRAVRAKDGAEGSVLLQDAFGNPVSSVRLSSAAVRGKTGEIRELGEGRYSFSYDAPDAEGDGVDQVRVRTESPPLELTADFTVLPPQKPWGVAAGALFRGNTNFTRMAGGGPLVELAVRAGSKTWELLLRGELNLYAVARVPYLAGGSGTTQVTSLSGGGLVAGARIPLPLSPHASLHGALTAGVRYTSSTIEILGSVVGPVRQTSSSWQPMLGAAAGGSVRLGPGRALGELGVTHSPMGGQVVGNAGGLSLTVGYLIDVP